MPSFYAKEDVPLAASDEEMEKLSAAEQRFFAVRMATDPPRTMAESTRLLGLTYSGGEKTWKRIRDKLGRDPLLPWKQKGALGSGSGVEQYERLRTVPVDTLVKLAEMRAEAVLRAITPDKLEKATVKELTSGYRELISSRQLLKGEPTQILQVNQRENLKRLFPIVLKQLHKRNISLDGVTPELAARFLPRHEPATIETVAEPEAPEAESAS